MMKNINEAFFSVCADAVAAEGSYVTLYCNTPYYGGPEEGGWWGSDTSVIAYYKCDSEAHAEAVQAKVEALAKELSTDAKRSFGVACKSQCEWLAARGLDSDFLPEVDGEENYYVSVEQTPGEQASKGCRHYE